MPLIALTGGIASGKSTIAARLAAHGAHIVDADAIVHQLQQPGSPVLTQIAEVFGDEVIRPDGSLDRAALGALVFGDDVALERLNGIMHPAVRAESARQFAEVLDADPSAVVVYDVPLFTRVQHQLPWDAVVVADAPASVREQRLVKLRGMTPVQARNRIAAQISDAERRSFADVIVDTSGTLDETLLQVDEIWERFQPKL